MKAGGFNNSFILGASNAAVPYDEEVIHSFEGDSKATLLDGRARVNASAYYYDYTNFQAFTFLGLGALVVNADAQGHGAELEATVTPTEHLEFVFGASYMDTEVENISNGVITKDREMAMAPEFTVNGLARSEWPAWGGMLAIQSDVFYTDERHFNVLNHPGVILKSYVVGNALVIYNGRRALVCGAVYQNLGDARPNLLTFPLAASYGIGEDIIHPPRWIGGTLSFRWQ